MPDPDLKQFKSSGGKPLPTHGWSGHHDHAGNHRILRVGADKMGKKQDDWLRLFMRSGMGHRGGGPGVNSLDWI
jgi:hypothetical protein